MCLCALVCKYVIHDHHYCYSTSNCFLSQCWLSGESRDAPTKGYSILVYSVVWNQSIVSGFSRQVDPINDKLCRGKLVGLGEEHHGRWNLFKLCLDFLMHLLKFVYLCRDLLAVVRARRQAIACQCNPSRRCSFQNWTPMWYHFQYWRKVWILLQECPLVVCGLNLIYPPPMDAVVAVLGLVVSVVAWDAGAAPSLASGAVLTTSSIGTAGEDASVGCGPWVSTGTLPPSLWREEEGLIATTGKGESANTSLAGL